MRKLLLASSFLTAVTAAHAQTVDLNLDAPVTMNGGSNSLLLGMPFGGGSQLTLGPTGEGEVYTASNVTQNAGGGITLTAQPNPNTSQAWPNNLPFTSGGVSTAALTNGMTAAGGFSALYGYFEMKAELPTGAGLWPAFWLMPVGANTACEIDVFEAPFNNPTLIQSSLHDGGTGFTTGQVTTPNYSTNFNTYGVNWSPTTITYYVNGKQTGSTPTPASCNSPEYVLASLAVGGQSWSWPGMPNSSNAWPAQMNIQSITYNPNGPPGGAGTDGGKIIDGGLVGGSASPGTTPPTSNPPLAGGTSPPPTISQIVPSGGTTTDCSGNTWSITADNQILENGKVVKGGGDTAALTVDGCSVWGLSNGEHGSKVGWFTMSNVSQNGNQFWQYQGITAVPPGLGAVASNTPSPTTPVNPTEFCTNANDGPRDPTQTPFASTSIFNLPLGSGAQWTPNAQLAGSNVVVNTTGNWNEPIYTGTASDPVVTVNNTGAAQGAAPMTYQVHIPAGAQPSQPTPGDNILTVDDTTTHMWCSFGEFSYTSATSAVAGQGSCESDSGSGMQFDNSNQDEGVGTLTETDLLSGTINHMLRINLPNDMLQSVSSNAGQLAANAWPQTKEDGFGPSAYTGTVPYGITMGIPATAVEPADVKANPGADILWRALQTHGAMIRDSGGSGNNVTFQTDQNVNPGDPLIQAMQQFGSQIMASVQILTNQSPTSVNGGGTPIVPLNPEVTDAAVGAAGNNTLASCTMSTTPVAVTAPPLTAASTAVTAPPMTPIADTITAPPLDPAPMSLSQVAAMAAGGP